MNYALIPLLAGLSSSALAQNFTLWLEPGSTTPSGNFTVSVYGDADVGTVYFSGVIGLNVVTLDGPNSVTNISWELALGLPFSPFSDLGYGGDGIHNGISFTSLVGPCDIIPCPDGALGSLIGTFTVEVDPNAFDAYQIDLIPGPDVDSAYPFTLQVQDDLTGELWDDSQGTLSLVGTSVTVVPAPSVTCVFACCSLCLLKRVKRKVM